MPIIFRLPVENAASSDRRSDLSELHAQVARLRPDCDPESSTFRIAVLLLAARAIGHNVDKLAQFTRCPREFVARCARRLVDNGVWANGTTVSCWDDPQGGTVAFWSDVGVAGGTLHRRVSEDGSLQWAPAGNWWKSYDFVQPESHGGPSVQYHLRCAPSAPAEEPVTRTPSAAAQSGRAATTPPRSGGAPASPATARSGVTPPAMPPARPNVALLGPPELFANTMWLA